jgi:hypothetical protein
LISITFSWYGASWCMPWMHAIGTADLGVGQWCHKLIPSQKDWCHGPKELPSTIGVWIDHCFIGKNPDWVPLFYWEESRLGKTNKKYQLLKRDSRSVSVTFWTDWFILHTWRTSYDTLIYFYGVTFWFSSLSVSDLISPLKSSHFQNSQFCSSGFSFVVRVIKWLWMPLEIIWGKYIFLCWGLEVHYMQINIMQWNRNLSSILRFWGAGLQVHINGTKIYLPF